MTLSMLHTDLGWVRVEILDCNLETDSIYVLMVDFGTEEWVSLTLEETKFRCIPDGLMKIPSQALTLQLPVAAVSTSPDEDTLLSLMAEAILSSDEEDQSLLIR